MSGPCEDESKMATEGADQEQALYLSHGTGAHAFRVYSAAIVICGTW